MIAKITKEVRGMKKQITTDYLELLADGNFTTYHYKVLCLLMTGTFTQAQLATRLGVKSQNIHRCVKELIEQGFVVVDRTEGRNVFLKAETSVGKIRQASNQIEGQLPL